MHENLSRLILCKYRNATLEQNLIQPAAKKANDFSICSLAKLCSRSEEGNKRYNGKLRFSNTNTF